MLQKFRMRNLQSLSASGYHLSNAGEIVRIFKALRHAVHSHAFKVMQVTTTGPEMGWESMPLDNFSPLLCFSRLQVLDPTLSERFQYASTMPL